MSEKNISPQPAEPKKGQKNTRRYTRKPKQNKGTDALSQAVQSAIEFVKDRWARAERRRRPRRKSRRRKITRSRRKSRSAKTRAARSRPSAAAEAAAKNRRSASSP